MTDVFEGWAIVELMGHRKLAGFVTEQEIAGTAFLRLDVHAETSGATPTVTQFYAPGAIYCITPATEDIARRLGERSSPVPVSRYELEPRKPPEDGPVEVVIHAADCQDAWCGGECEEATMPP